MYGEQLAGDHLGVPMRRVVSDGTVDAVSETRVVEHSSIADTIAAILSVIYTAIMSIIGLDTLLKALDAREANGFVSAIDTFAGVFLRPFEGVFSDQRYWGTALIAAAVYTVIYLIAMAAMRRDRAVI